MRKRFLIYVLCTLTLFSATVGIAQTTEKSRLRIGENPKPTSTAKETLSAFIVNPNIKKEISYNKFQTVNDFYRQLLLSNAAGKSTSVPVASKSVAAVEATEEALFDNVKLRVSNIYPNPANLFAKIDYEIKSGSPKVELTFYDMLVRKISTYELTDSDRSIRVDTQGWDNGLYMYQLVVDGKKVATKKLLVRHN